MVKEITFVIESRVYFTLFHEFVSFQAGSSIVSNARVQQCFFMLTRLPALPTPSLCSATLTIKVPVSFISVTVKY